MNEFMVLCSFSSFHSFQALPTKQFFQSGSPQPQLIQLSSLTGQGPTHFFTEAPSLGESTDPMKTCHCFLVPVKGCTLL